jgi:hypothetical protein
MSGVLSPPMRAQDPGVIASYWVDLRPGASSRGKVVEVGKQSREKRERRERDGRPVAGLVGGFASRSLIVLLEAASVSSTAAYRGRSIASLFHAVA